MDYILDLISVVSELGTVHDVCPHESTFRKLHAVRLLKLFSASVDVTTAGHEPPLWSQSLYCC